MIIRSEPMSDNLYVRVFTVPDTVVVLLMVLIYLILLPLGLKCVFDTVSWNGISKTFNLDAPILCHFTIFMKFFSISQIESQVISNDQLVLSRQMNVNIHGSTVFKISLS